MLWITALHIIFVVCWFAAIFYLPRLYVYHCEAMDETSNARFKIMERRLYRGIMWPSGILTSITGLILLFHKYDYYATQNWMHVKLILVMGLWVFHLYCGYLRKQFEQNKNKYSDKFYRILNEVPTVILIVVVIMVVVKPQF